MNEINVVCFVISFVVLFGTGAAQIPRITSRPKRANKKSIENGIYLIFGILKLFFLFVLSDRRAAQTEF